METRCHFALAWHTRDALVQRRALSATQACVSSTLHVLFLSLTDLLSEPQLTPLLDHFLMVRICHFNETCVHHVRLPLLILNIQNRCWPACPVFMHRNARLTHLRVLQNSLSKPRVNVSHQQISDVVFAMCRVAGAAIMGCHECAMLPMHHMIACWLPSCSIDCLPCNQFLLKPTQRNDSFTCKTERMQLEAEWKLNNLRSTKTKCVTDQQCTIVAL